MTEERRAFRIFRKVVYGIWAILTVMTVFASFPTREDWTHAAFFFLFAALCEALPVHLAERGEVSLTHLVVWAAMLVCPPITVMIIPFMAVVVAHGSKWAFARMYQSYVRSPDTGEGAVAALRELFLGRIARMLAFDWIDRHSYPLKHVASLLIMNGSLEAIYAGASSLAYSATGGVTIYAHGGEQMGLTRTILPMLTAALIYFVLDSSAFSITCVLYENRPEYTRSWRFGFLRWKVLMLQAVPAIAARYVLVVFFAFSFVWTYANYGLIFVALLILPVYLIGHSMRQTEQMKQTYRETITALGVYIQMYHPYTRGHLKRVAELSERLARELNLPAESVRWMPDAGLLHDIGKVGVSEEILDKPGRPTDEEWAKIQEHPVNGARIISQMQFLDKIVDWVKYHHKWFDGSGYPDDGRNGDVPIEAHIIAVADAFDAMTDDREMAEKWSCDSCGYAPENGDRPTVCPQCGAEKGRRYRKPLTLDEAMDELRRGVGTQFRPEVVKAFLRMIHREGVHLGQSS